MGAPLGGYDRWISGMESCEAMRRGQCGEPDRRGRAIREPAAGRRREQAGPGSGWALLRDNGMVRWVGLPSFGWYQRGCPFALGV